MLHLHYNALCSRYELNTKGKKHNYCYFVTGSSSTMRQSLRKAFSLGISLPFPLVSPLGTLKPAVQVYEPTSPHLPHRKLSHGILPARGPAW